MAESQNYKQPEESSGKVIKGTAKIEKRTLSKKLVDFLFSDKIDSIGLYLLQEVLGPSLRDLLYRTIVGAASMSIYGGMQNGAPGSALSQRYSGAKRDPVPYNTMSNGYYGPSYGYSPAPQPGIYAPRMSLNDISFDTKDDAYLVLDRMNHEIGRYQKVRVADFYIFAGITGQEGNWALQGNGWYDLRDAKPIMRTDGRWIIDFPPIQPLR